ncbi:hypothetical protein TNIN_496121 [Trichonephila inaurata madagascariensis]|uniref:Uncharacterized protein n=1 Tax=Trichonephila inaurata madagascariensis TaxID=2747483 RepID=A0A8X6XCB8_9ARAC|nr:hypothetical protein TNIN_496121 [Trichonephila inaurata madagascariensis]
MSITLFPKTCDSLDEWSHVTPCETYQRHSDRIRPLAKKMDGVLPLPSVLVFLSALKADYITALAHSFTAILQNNF